MKNLSFLAMLLIVGAGCMSKQRATSLVKGLPVINIDDVESTDEPFRLSEIAERIEYVPLEFTPECPVSNPIFQSFISSTDIFISCRSGFLHFDSNGKFLNSIGKPGRGPGEYLAGTMFFAVDTIERHFYMSENYVGNIRVYDYEGRYLHTVKKDYTHSNITFFFQQGKQLAAVSGTFTSHRAFERESDFFLMVTDTANNKIIHTNTSISYIVPPDKHTVWDVGYLQNGDSLYVLEGMNDTVYIYRPSNLHAGLLLNCGAYEVTLDALLLNDDDACSRYYRKRIIGETSRYLFYNPQNQMCFLQKRNVLFLI